MGSCARPKSRKLSNLHMNILGSFGPECEGVPPHSWTVAHTRRDARYPSSRTAQGTGDDTIAKEHSETHCTASRRAERRESDEDYSRGERSAGRHASPIRDR